MGCQADYKCCSKCISIIHILLGIGSIFIGALRFISFDVFSPQDFILSIYLMFLGLILSFVSCGLKGITNRFLFLNYFAGKGFFDLFLATAVISLNQTIWIILSIFYFVSAVFCFFLGCVYRSTEREQLEQKQTNEKGGRQNSQAGMKKKAKK